jgi:hypothetical protein
MTTPQTRVAAAAALLLSLTLAGCHDDLTQVVLVIESDLSVPGEIDALDVTAIDGPYAPTLPPGFTGSGPLPEGFPLSIGFLSFGKTHRFSFVVRLFHGPTTLVSSRTVTDVRFITQQTLMLMLPMPRACACMGSTCPTPDSNPECANVDQPTLLPFDPAVAPPSTMMPVGHSSTQPPQGIP